MPPYRDMVCELCWWSAKAHSFSPAASRVVEQYAILSAAELLELDYGQVCFPSMPGAVNVVGLSICEVTGILLNHAHLKHEYSFLAGCKMHCASYADVAHSKV